MPAPIGAVTPGQMRLKPLIAVLVFGLGIGFAVGISLAGEGPEAAPPAAKAPLPEKAKAPKAVKVAGLDRAARIPTLVEVRRAVGTTGRTTNPIRTTATVQTRTTVTPPPRPTVDPDPSE